MLGALPLGDRGAYLRGDAVRAVRRQIDPRIDEERRHVIEQFE